MVKIKFKLFHNCKIEYELSQVISAVFEYVLIAAASQSAAYHDSALPLSLNKNMSSFHPFNQPFFSPIENVKPQSRNAYCCSAQKQCQFIVVAMLLALGASA
jgi:hypothetical protein